MDTEAAVSSNTVTPRPCQSNVLLRDADFEEVLVYFSLMIVDVILELAPHE